MNVFTTCSALLLFILASCNSTKKTQHYSEPIKSLNVAKAQLLMVKKCAVMVVTDKNAPDKVACFYVLQGTTTKEQTISTSILNASNDFVSLQAGSNFWVLTLAESDRYKRFLTDGSNAKILKGFGLAKFQDGAPDFDVFIAELRSGLHDSKFN